MIMDTEKIRSFIQPVVVQETNGNHILRCERTDPDVIARASHLADTVRVFRTPLMSGVSRRYILHAPDRDLALQAAAALLSLTAACDEESPQGEEQEWDDILWDDPEQDDSGYDCLIRRQDEFVKDAGDEMGAVISFITSENRQGEDNEADPDFLFIDCGDEFSEKLPEKLAFMSSRMVMLWVRNISVCRFELEQLMFDQGYRIIHIPRPELSYYEEVLREYLVLCGYDRKKHPDCRELIEKLLRYRNQRFELNDIFRFADRAILNAGMKQSQTLSENDFALPRIREREEPEDRLKKMIGLKEVKNQIEKVCAERILLGEKEGTDFMHTGYNLAFAGPPGTGKSVVAALYAEILSKTRVTSGAFVSASRADIVGQYLGHTAPKIKKLFDKADGGVLFVDEAGGMSGNDEFTKEAVTEFVRFMEQRPQTTVIFATYPDKMEEFLNQDPGLRSRISRVIHFPSYTDGELLQILYLMTEKERCTIEEGNEELIRSFFGKMRTQQGESFGNAREARRFLKASFSNYCVRALGEKRKNGGKPDFVIRRSELEQAVRDILPGRRQMHKIGFRMSEPGKGGVEV